MEFNSLRLLHTAHFTKFLPAFDTVLMPAGTFPDIERCAPVAVARDCPVLNIFQPVAKAPLSDGLRNPVDCVIVAQKIVAHRSFPDIPRFPRIIDKRRVTAPTVRVAMLKFWCVKEPAVLLHIL